MTRLGLCDLHDDVGRMVHMLFPASGVGPSVQHTLYSFHFQATSPRQLVEQEGGQIVPVPCQPDLEGNFCLPLPSLLLEKCETTIRARPFLYLLFLCGTNYSRQPPVLPVTFPLLKILSPTCRGKYSLLLQQWVPRIMKCSLLTDLRMS